MNLLVYSHYFAPSIGGVEVIIESLARGLAALRDPGGQPSFRVTLVTQTPSAGFDDGSLPFPVVRKPALLRLWRLVRGADVIHLAGPALEPLLLAWLARKPVAIEHHGYQAVCPNGHLLLEPLRTACPGHFQAGRYLRCLRCRAIETSWLRSAADLLTMFPRNWLSRKAQANISISGHVLRRQGLSRAEVVYYGIDVTGPAEGAAELLERNARFAYVGRFSQEKGVEVLVDAARLLRDAGMPFQLVLIGDGPQRADIEAKVERDGLRENVRTTGFLTGGRLAEELAGVGVVIMPSVCEETAGLSAIEQMMRGRLVIASETGGLGEVVGGAGLKVPAGDPQALAEAMKRVLRQPGLAESLGQKGRERALQLFARVRMIEEHARIYRGLLRAS